MSDYSNAKVYKLYVTDIKDTCYIGSTCNILSQRLSQHKYAARGDTQKKCAATVLFLEYGDEVIIELLEDYPCDTKEKLLERERYWIEQTDGALNKNIPGQTWEERWAKNKERNSALHKEWLKANKESEALKKKERRLANPDATKAADKESYEKNKAARLAAKKEKVVCPICLKTMNKNSLWEHNKKLHTVA